MVKKITDAGWMKEESTGYYINPRNRYKLSLDNSSLTIYFGTNESSTSAVNNVPETDYVESED